MANQQPARPWFRVGSISRPVPPPAQPPAPAPEVVAAPSQPRPFRSITAPAATQPPVTRPPGPALQPTGAPSPSLRPLNGGAATVQAPPTVRADSSNVASSPRPEITPAPSSSLPSSLVRKPAAAAAVSSVPGSPVQPPNPKTSSVPNSPVRNPVPAISSVPNSPKPVATVSSVRNSPAIKAILELSPRSVKPEAETPPQSPKRNPTAPPPSPLTLPPSQLKPEPEPEPNFPPETEQKTVVHQKTVERKFWSSGIKSEGSPWNPLTKGKEENHKKKIPSDSDDKGTRIITIAGENRGALMELFRPTRKSGNHPFPGNPRYLDSRGNPGTSSGSGSSSEEDDKKKKKGESRRRGSGRGRGGATPMGGAVMNSNVQGINNSIMFNSSCNHHDPGVHVALSRNPSDAGGNGGSYHVKDHRNNNGYQS